MLSKLIRHTLFKIFLKKNSLSILSSIFLSFMFLHWFGKKTMQFSRANKTLWTEIKLESKTEAVRVRQWDRHLEWCGCENKQFIKLQESKSQVTETGPQRDKNDWTIQINIRHMHICVCVCVKPLLACEIFIAPVPTASHRQLIITPIKSSFGSTASQTTH